MKTNHIIAAPLGELGRLLSESGDLALSDGRPLNFRTVPNLPALFSEEGSNPLLKRHQITATPLGNLRALLSEIAGLALSDSRHLNFGAMPHLSAVFS